MLTETTLSALHIRLDRPGKTRIQMHEIVVIASCHGCFNEILRVCIEVC